MSLPDISVVIPTTGRSSLLRAVESARGQKGVSIEIVVVADTRSPLTAPQRALDLADRVVHTGGGRGGAHARNLGVAHAGGSWVAFLDDDDEWEATKSTEQLRAAMARDAAVVSCQVIERRGDGTTTSPPTPAIVYEAPTPIENYLFRRRRPSVTRAGMYTSTLLVRSDLARETPWREGLPRHQDWDWLIRLDRAGAEILQLPLAAVTIWMGSHGSLSAGSDWESSLSWARSWQADWDAQTYVDFVAGQPLRYALQARSAQGVAECLRSMRAARRLPSVSTAALAAAGLMGRHRMERVMTRKR